MKASSLLLTLTLLASCGQLTPQQAEETASRYLKTTLHDPGSYELVRASSRRYTRQDSLAYAAQVASRRQGVASGSLAGKPSRSLRQQDTTRVGWLVQLTYRVRNGYAPASEEHGTFVVYSPELVVPVSP